MSQAEAADPEYFIPLEYKIVDLPITPLQVIHTLKTFPCKIYRRVCLNAGEPGAPSHEWKRKCHGRIKFVEAEGRILVAAFQYGSCHNRLREEPVQHPLFYNLQPSEEFEHNWVYTNQEGLEISIALSEADYGVFGVEWETAKDVNTMMQAEHWLIDISDDVFM